MLKPSVFVIRISDNPVSMWFAGRTTYSWESAGYQVQIVEAVTPETMDDQYDQLNFASTKVHGQNKRPFTETEKAVFYSHIKVLEIAARKQSPSIIVEHDGECIQPWLNPSIYDEEIVPLANKMPAVGYFIRAKAAQELAKRLKITQLKGNLDFYIWEKMLEYNTSSEMNLYRNIVMHNLDPSIGNTIEHPDYEYARKK